MAIIKVKTSSTAKAGLNYGELAIGANELYFGDASGVSIKVATDSNVVHKTGNETIAGVKTFSADIKTTTQSTAYTIENVFRFNTTDSPVQTVVYTGIKYQSSTHMPVVRIYGYAYGLTSPIELKIGFYIYGGNLGWAGVVSMGAWRPQVYLFKYNTGGVDYVAIGLSGSCYYLAFQVDVQSVNFTGNIGSSILTTGWSSAFRNQSQVDGGSTIIPAVGVDNCIAVDYKSTLTNLALQFNGVTQVNYDGATARVLNITPAGIGALSTTGTATDSDKLDGQHGSYYTTAGNLTGTIPSAVLGNSTVYIGTTAVVLNRASATLALTGVTNTNWDVAYTHSTATTGSVHGSTTVGGNLLRLTNVTTSDKFLRVNFSDNSVSALDASTFRTAIGAEPAITKGTTSQYFRGDMSLATMPTTMAPTNHNLVDTTKHPVSGLTAGHFMKALSATTYGFVAHGLSYSDVSAAPTSHASTATTYGAATTSNYGHVILGAAGGAATYEHIHPVFVGATGSEAGIAGLVPAPSDAQSTAFLKGNGNWSSITYSDLSGTVPTWNQNTTGNAATLKSPTTTGLVQFSGMTAGVTRVITVPDANVSMLYSGGALGTPSSGNLSNCTFPTLNQNTTGTAANVTGTVAVANGGTGNTSVDTTPTASSTKMVTSGGIHSALTTKADTTHKYHSFSPGQYFFDTYEQGNYFRLFTEIASFDQFRFQPISSVEYFDGSSWVGWTDGDAYIKLLLDGREETGFGLDHTHRRFRFVVQRSGAWPTMALLVLQETWTGLNHPNTTIKIETWNGSAWVLKDTTVFGVGTTGNFLGIHVKATNTVHDGIANTRVSVEMEDWTDSGSFTTIPLRRLMFLSNFNGGLIHPWSWDYNKTVTFPATVNATTFVGSLTGSVSGNAATATKLGTSTVGSTTLPIYLNAGAPTALTQANLRIGVFGSTAIGSASQPVYIAANGVATAGNSIPSVSSNPTDGATTTAISSDWAFDNVKTSVPSGAVFTDTWNANSLNVAGYVAAPTSSNANKVWKTDASGNPAWRDDANTTYVEATNSVLGLVKIGYTTTAKNYAVQLSSGQMYVNVPWTDTNTTYSIKASTQTGGAGLDLDAGGSGSGTDTVTIKGSGATSVAYTDANTITISSTNTTYSAATSSTLGLIKLVNNTQQTVAPNELTTADSRSYAVQFNASSQLVVNVPWTDTVYTLPLAASGTRGGIQIGYNTSGNNYAVQLSSEKAYVNVPWTDTVYTHPDDDGNKHVPANGTTNNGKFLMAASTAGDYSWTTITQNATHTGEVTGSGALTIASDVVTNAKLANMAASTIKGRITASTGDPQDLTTDQVKSMLVLSINTISSNTTITSTYVNGIMDVNGASANVVITVPASGTYNPPVGTQVTIVHRSAFKVSVDGPSNVTIVSTDGYKYISKSGAIATLVKLDTDTWLLAGALVAS